jgi:hypothetical protein
MENEVPLPPPQRVRHRSPSTRSNNLLATSLPFQKPKRPSRSRRSDVSSIPSSDPALFSSDDIPSSSLENYRGQPQPENSKKRRYRGTWWGEMAMEVKKKRADFREKRNLDSGIWMGSDESSSECLLSSESSSDDYLRNSPGWISQEQKATTPVADSVGTPITTQAEGNKGPTFLSRNIRGVEEPTGHLDARAVVNDCLDKGRDSVDLR